LAFAFFWTLFTSVTLEAGGKWPPQPGELFPDLKLVDQSGSSVAVSEFRGKVLLVEFVGMTCPACQAFAGAHARGSFSGVRPQKRLDSIRTYLSRYSGVSLGDERVVLLQILLYGLDMKAPTSEDARRWAEHFGMERSRGEGVLAGTKEHLGPASFDLIPGFQLVDRNFIVRRDSTGHRPRHDLYSELLPLVPKLFATEPAAATGDRIFGLYQMFHETPWVGVLPAAGPDRSSGDRSSGDRSSGDRSSGARRTVEDAYRAIPHRRTAFDAKSARMEVEERRFLEAFFEVVDQAVVARVERTAWLTSGGKRGSARGRHGEVLAALNRLEAPASLGKVRDLVIAAVKDQRNFLDKVASTRQLTKEQISRDPAVVSASRKLRQAYSRLMRLFASEGANNKRAFFDYLCALDFI